MLNKKQSQSNLRNQRPFYYFICILLARCVALNLKALANLEIRCLSYYAINSSFSFARIRRSLRPGRETNTEPPIIKYLLQSSNYFRMVSTIVSSVSKQSQSRRCLFRFQIKNQDIVYTIFSTELLIVLGEFVNEINHMLLRTIYCFLSRHIISLSS